MNMEKSSGAGGAETEMNKRVMVAIDESDESMHALDWALENISRRFGINVPESSEEEDFGVVFLTHVQPPTQHYLFPAGSAAVMESLKKAQRENTASVLSRALSICKRRMVKAETLILDGEPKEVICEAVDRMNISLLVTGSRGLNALKRAFLGSVSDYCAQHANCPILIVKPPKPVANPSPSE